ncbi:MAG TPA: hypothetical protein VKA10_08570 [Prolixibacteraceae bacterium]|nr:hypothetical protein [Prolixibacteraceae bacterium]
MNETKQVRTDFNITALLEATGGNEAFFQQMLNTFIENAENTYNGLKDGLQTKNWELIGEKAHKAIPSFKYFALNEFVNRFKLLEDITIRTPEYQRVPGVVNDLLKELEVLISDVREVKFPE